MPKRNAKVIINPISGKGAYQDMLPMLETSMRNAGWIYDIDVPDSEGDTKRIIFESRNEGFDTVIACGGDGTVHTAINSMDIENQALGIVPIGSGNDFFRMLRIESDPVTAIRNVIDGEDWKIDVGDCNGVKFVNTAGSGIDSQTLIVREETTGWVKRNYVILFMKTLSRLNPYWMKITADGKVIEDEFMWVIVCNSRFIGGGMMIGPNSSIDDGLFNLMLIRKMSKLGMVCQIPAIFKGTFINHPAVSEIKASEITMETKTPLRLGVDGDLGPETPAKFTMHKRVLSLISTVCKNK